MEPIIMKYKGERMVETGNGSCRYVKCSVYRVNGESFGTLAEAQKYIDEWHKRQSHIELMREFGENA